MRKANELKGRMRGGLAALMLAFGIFAVGFCGASLTGHAAGQAKVTAPNGAKIRESADTASAMVGGAEKDKVLSVLGQTQGADGYTWYQVQGSDTTVGYVRSDLVEVSGDIPTGTTGGEGNEGGEAAPPAEVTQVNPISATVSGETVEIRDTASLAGQVLGTVPGETAVTITGYVTDAEGTTWYQVNYISEEAEVSGFLLSDVCTLSGDLTPVGQEPPQSEETPEPTPEPAPSRYVIVEKDGVALLVDNETDPGNGYPVEDLLENLQKNAKLYFDSEEKVKSQKIIIIVLVFLLVAAVAGIAFLVFKIREMMDSAYFSEVENETLRRKKANDGTGKRPAMHTVGPKEEQPRAAGARPAQAAKRPAEPTDKRPAAAAGQRSAEARNSAQGQRVAGRGTAARPAGGSVQGQRPAQASRPAGGVQGQGRGGTAPRTGGAQGQRPVGASQGARPQPKAPQGARPGQSAQKAQPKNFMADEDEFEFEFLNYDGDEE